MAPPSIPRPKANVLLVYRLGIPSSGQLDVADNTVAGVRIVPGPFQLSTPETRQDHWGSTATMTSRVRRVDVPDGMYLVCQVAADPSVPGNREDVALRLALVAALCALKYSHVLVERVFEGVVLPADGSMYLMWPEGPITITTSTGPTAATVAAHLSQYLGALQHADERTSRLLQLGARWITRGLASTNQIDQLLYLWLALEVYPGKQGRGIEHNVANLLHHVRYRDITASELKCRLWLGRLHGLRSEVVHAGLAFPPSHREQEFAEALVRLRMVSIACYRHLAGVGDDGELDRYARLATSQ